MTNLPKLIKDLEIHLICDCGHAYVGGEGLRLMNMLHALRIQITKMGDDFNGLNPWDAPDSYWEPNESEKFWADMVDTMESLEERFKAIISEELKV